MIISLKTKLQDVSALRPPIIPIILSDARCKVVSAISTEITELALFYGIPQKIIEAIPKHITSLHLNQEDADEILAALPTHINYVHFMGNVPQRILSRIPTSIHHIGLSYGVTVDAIQSLPGHINKVTFHSDPLVDNIICELPKTIKSLEFLYPIASDIAGSVPNHVTQVFMVHGSSGLPILQIRGIEVFQISRPETFVSFSALNSYYQTPSPPTQTIPPTSSILKRSAPSSNQLGSVDLKKQRIACLKPPISFFDASKSEPLEVASECSSIGPSLVDFDLGK